MLFNKEADFEHALIHELKNKGWEDTVLHYPSEADLLNNWASILFDNNREIDRLNNTPLSESEMQQIIEQMTDLKTPLKLNGFINGKTVAITRDHPDDPLHLGKEVSLKIYDRQEIAAGQSRYQIVQQPQFKSQSKILNNRRGDILLLINGMPVIHIELKKSGIPVSHATHQIEQYSAEGIFSGLFSLVQVFVAMEPQETVYFANPGSGGRFNNDFYFHWADFNNEPINDWKTITSTLLSIPMAHQLIGFYTVADGSDGVLKVMRSYQYFAVNALSDKVSKTNWHDNNQRGGYIWHTTGSGKTMTSFKSAQLMAHSKEADKVIFLMDRIELGVQSLREYQGFSDESESVQATENTGVLITKLKSSDPANTLIVTSIQKMSNINEQDGRLKSHDIEHINLKRMVFIVDEAHRSTFGDMLIIIKKTFPSALFFGFTGTPIQEENQKEMNTTTSVFGNELHRYSIADGIRDKNVLGFDPYQVKTYKDEDLRTSVALEHAKAEDEREAFSDPKKKKTFNTFMQTVNMAGDIDATGKYIKGIEDYLPKSQYTRMEHKEKVIEDIIHHFLRLSQDYQFHAIFATSSITDAINYYRLLKEKRTQERLELKITALFDPSLEQSGGDDGGDILFKQKALVEIIEDYNTQYEQNFTLSNHAKFKKDIAARLAHKDPYTRIDTTPEKHIDVLIVVDQMLTGFDSKWLNTLYLDKVLKYEHIIQAFSRTNRLFNHHDKPFGIIRYYRYPHTMDRNIKEAVKLYSGDKPLGLFVERLDSNLKQLNVIYNDMVELFENAHIEAFEKLPQDLSECGQFAKLFKTFNEHLVAAKIQGFAWDQADPAIPLCVDEKNYLILALRYKELSKRAGEGEGEGNGEGGGEEVPFDIDGYLTEIDTAKIDTDYMNTRFEKYLKILRQDSADSEALQKILDELHKSFASLSEDDQKYANIFLHDVQSGEATLDQNKTFREHITAYHAKAKHSEVDVMAERLGLDKHKLNSLMNTDINPSNINDYGRFDDLKETVDKAKAKAYFEQLSGTSIPLFKVNIKVHTLLQDFIIRGGFDLP